MYHEILLSRFTMRQSPACISNRSTLTLCESLVPRCPKWWELGTEAVSIRFLEAIVDSPTPSAFCFEFSARVANSTFQSPHLVALPLFVAHPFAYRPKLVPRLLGGDPFPKLLDNCLNLDHFRSFRCQHQSFRIQILGYTCSPVPSRHADRVDQIYARRLCYLSLTKTWLELFVSNTTVELWVMGFFCRSSWSFRSISRQDSRSVHFA